MNPKSILLSLLAMILAIFSFAGCGGGSSNTGTVANPFAGEWYGQYQISGNYNQTGSIDTSIDSSGNVLVFNPTDTKVSNLQAHVDDNGNLNVSYQESGKTITISGKAQLSGGRLLFTGTINIPSVGNCLETAVLWPKSIFNTMFHGSYSISNGTTAIDQGEITNLTIFTNTTFDGTITSQTYGSSILIGSCNLDGDIAGGYFQFEGYNPIGLSGGTVIFNNGSISVSANGSWEPYGNITVTTVLSPQQ